MKIQRFISNLLESNMYIITENENCIIIDPWQDTDCYIKDFSYDMIILTHEHYDHISGVNIWKDLTGAKVLCSSECASLIEDPKRNFSRHFKDFALLQTTIDSSSIPDDVPNNYSCKADEIFIDIKVMQWQGHEIKLFETPGHSSGSSCILIDNQYLFSGDTLLHNYETALRFPGSSKKMWNAITIPEIKNLYGKIVVYPGHFETFNLEDWIGWKIK